MAVELQAEWKGEQNMIIDGRAELGLTVINPSVNVDEVVIEIEEVVSTTSKDETVLRRSERKSSNRLSDIICSLQKTYHNNNTSLIEETTDISYNQNNNRVVENTDQRKCAFTKYVYIGTTSAGIQNKIHVCDICGYENRRIGLFASHMKNEHDVHDAFECHDCPFRSPSYPSYASHRKSHRNNHSNTKQLAGEVSSEPINLNIERCENARYIYLYHYPGGVTKKAHRCDKCHFETAKISVFAKHMLSIHGISDVYECHNCAFTCNSYSEYNKHCKHHAASNKVVYRSKNNDQKRLENAGRLICEICGYIARSKFVLKRHMIRHTDDRPFSCSKCDHRTTSEKLLACHMASKHKEGMELLRCTFEGCDFSTIYKASLTRHVGLHDIDRSNLCLSCGYVAKRQTEFRRHVKLHLGMKEFKCPYCDYMAYEQHSVRGHMVKHTKTPEYVCEFCGTVKSTAYDMKRHVMSHRGLKPYACGECGSQFSERESTDRHIRVKHRGVGTVVKTNAHETIEITRKDSGSSSEVLRVNYAMRFLTDGKIEVYVSNMQKIEDKDVLSVQCNECEYVSQSNNALVLHQLIEHTDCLRSLPPITDETRRIRKSFIVNVVDDESINVAAETEVQTRESDDNVR
ncbi:uncharacterized protein LOC141905768 isoform X2 [Tubulanus polymorphus]|uniref:uncharacterized protein LOC141905768 isoform X2 n=1 Tax=Tubulanus polymorphus TaxID=672921 RepID=UPI003DA3FCA6